MIGDLFAQLAAGRIHIAAELAAHSDIHARLLQNADECLEMLRRGRPECALFYVVERDEVHVRTDAPRVLGQQPGMLRRVVHAVDHGVFKGNAPAGRFIIPGAGVDERRHATAVVGRHDLRAGGNAPFSPCILVVRIEKRANLMCY